MDISVEPFGTTKHGEVCSKWTISNGNMSIMVTDLGATVLGVWLPDTNSSGGYVNVAPCHQQLAQLETSDLAANPKMGTTCGRVANRTANAAFELDNKTYTLVKNDGANHLHGGTRGFDSLVWKLDNIVVKSEAAAITLVVISPHMDEGYPGTVTTKCTISLTKGNCMGIEYYSTVDEMTTVVALTNHCYWALSGLQEGTIDNHILQIHSDEFVPADLKSYIPVGGLAPVSVPVLSGTDTSSSSSVDNSSNGEDKPGPFDFRTPSRVGDKIKDLSVRDPNKGYNVSFVVRGWKAPNKQKNNSGDVSADRKHEIAKAATGAVLRAHMDVDTERSAQVHSVGAIERLLPAGTLTHNGRRLDVATTAPCIHLYTTFAWDATKLCEGISMKPGSALALECQFPADAANRSFGPIPRCTLTPTEEYHHLILHKFTW